MDVSIATIWWVAAGALVAAELATGTFYLLMMALGLAGAALTAHVGLPLAWQVAMAALVGGGATALWHWQCTRSEPSHASVAHNRDVNLDIGERVTVTLWNSDHTTRVNYRGSLWTARLTPDASEVTGEHIVQAVEGNWLVIAPVSR